MVEWSGNVGEIFGKVLEVELQWWKVGGWRMMS